VVHTRLRYDNHVTPSFVSYHEMKQTNPPGPVGRWGGINHLRAIRADFRVFAHALHQTYGDTVYYRVLGQQLFQFASPTLAHEVLVGQAKSLHKPANQKRAFGRIIGNNLFTSDGEFWQARRRMLAPLFQPQIIDRYRAIVIRQAERVIGQLSSGVVDVSRTASTITLLSVAEALFGAAIHEVADQFQDVVNRLQGAVSRQILSPVLVPLWIPTRDNRTVTSSMRFFQRLMSSLIEQRRQSPSRYGDLLAALLEASDADGAARLTDRQVMDEAMTILLAGSDTTAAAVTWSAYLLAKHAEHQRALQHEVANVAAGGSLQVEHADSLGFAQQVFQESMRLYPPGVAIARQATEPVEIGGFQIPRGALVFVIVYSIHHNPRWFPEPAKFIPSRFASERETEIPANAYLPFGLGPRACIGRRFAMMEGPLILAELARQFELKLTDPCFEPQLENQLTLHPRNGLQLRLKRRSEVQAPASAQKSV
jgi:cytochrome P450